MKILIVDDEKSLCEIYTLLFNSHGYDVKASRNGLAAITDAVDFQPDIILLDILMPEMNGYDFLKALKNNTSMDPVVIIFSNLNEQTEIDYAMQHGADAYLQKSDFTGEALVEKVLEIYNDVQSKREKK